MAVTGKILLIGAGKMGGALLEGWLTHGLTPTEVAVIDPSPPSEMQTFLSEQKIERAPKVGEFLPDAIVIATKPQIASQVMPGIGAYLRPKTVVISIMAGRTIASLEKDLPAGTAIVRAMTNTPASIARGMTVAVGNGHVDSGGRLCATELLSAAGEVEWVEDEGLMDAITAVSGSGPAYIFLLAETLTKAGIEAGLPKELAIRLARETIAGAGELMRHTQIHPTKLRENVTSPGGTTAAALEVLMGKDGFESLLKRAVDAAVKRSRELAN